MKDCIIKLENRIEGKKLEEICKLAAQKLGYKTSTKDVYSFRFRLGTYAKQKDYNKFMGVLIFYFTNPEYVCQYSTCQETKIRIGNLFPVLEVKGIRKDLEQDTFILGFNSTRRLKEYLNFLFKSLPLSIG